MSTKPAIVFCHGIWADGSCFSKVIPALQADGHEVISVQYSLESYQADLDILKRTINRVSGPVLLVGHSYGGATITGAGVDDRVLGLVYIAAVAPDVGETVNDQLNKFPSDIFSRVEVHDGLAWMLPSGTEFFCGDLPEAEQKLVWATHFPPNMNLFNEQMLTANQIGWKSKPSWYLLATKDHTVHPDLQRWVSKRMGAKVTEVASSHRPDALPARGRPRSDPQGRRIGRRPRRGLGQATPKPGRLAPAHFVAPALLCVPIDEENVMSLGVFAMPVWTCVSAAAAASSTVLTAAIFMATQISTARYQRADFYIKITDRYNSHAMIEALREVVLFRNEHRDDFAEIFGAEHAKQSAIGIKLNHSCGVVSRYFRQVADMYHRRLIDASLARMLCNFYGLNIYYQVVVPMGWARTDMSHAHDRHIVETLKSLKPQYGDGQIGGAP